MEFKLGIIGKKMYGDKNFMNMEILEEGEAKNEEINQAHIPIMEDDYS